MFLAKFFKISHSRKYIHAKPSSFANIKSQKIKNYRDLLSYLKFLRIKYLNRHLFEFFCYNNTFLNNVFLWTLGLLNYRISLGSVGTTIIWITRIVLSLQRSNSLYYSLYSSFIKLTSTSEIYLNKYLLVFYLQNTLYLAKYSKIMMFFYSFSIGPLNPYSFRK